VKSTAYFVADCQKLQKRESLEFTETTGLQSEKHCSYHVVNMLNFRVISYNLYCTVTYCIDNSSNNV